MPNFEKGDRIVAVRNHDTENNVVYLFGKGTYEGMEVPGDDVMGASQFRIAEVKNPKLVMDDGTVVWGMECWWGGEETIMKKIDDSAAVVKIVKPVRVVPKEIKGADAWN